MTDPQRHVAVVVPSLTEAGAERVAATLAREFARTSRVTVVTMEPRLRASEVRKVSVLPWADRVPSGCEQVHLPSRGSGLFRLLPLAVRLALLARGQRFDVVYSFLTWTNVLVALAKLMGGDYVHVASEHAMAESLRSDGVGLRRLSRVLPVVYRLPDRIVVVSAAARSSLSGAGYLPRPERTVTIPNPVDEAEIKRLAQLPTSAVPFPAGRRIVLCVARLHVQKDHVTLLRAMSDLPPLFVLALMGDGPLRQELEDTTRSLGLSERVIFLGSMANPYPRMLEADVLVLPSKEEGFGLVAVEAAVLGVPFVGSAVGGLREVCGIFGHRTFPVGDHHALAAALVAATSEPRLPRDTAEVALRAYRPSTVADLYLGLLP